MTSINKNHAESIQMIEYHKIHSVYKREPTGKRHLIEGQWSLPEFEYLANNQWDWTEKVDGTNIRVIRTETGVRYAGRTDNAQLPAKLLDRLKERFEDNSAFLDLPYGSCLYGEGYGAKIQKGGNYRPDQDFVLFDVLIGYTWLTQSSVVQVADELKIDVVPMVAYGTLYEAIEAVKGGIQSFWGDFIAEGLVCRPSIELISRTGERIITKIKHKDFPR
jgi:hypothetical protein